MNMSTLQYSFPKSRDIIEKLSRQQIPLRPAISNDLALEYIDESLALLGGRLRTQDDTLRHEFTQQKRFIESRLGSFSEDQAKRDIDLQEKLETLDQEISEGFQELRRSHQEHGQALQELKQSHQELGKGLERMQLQLDTLTKQVKEQEVRDIRGRNGRLFRLHHRIEPVPQITEEGAYQLPDAFPRTVKQFWRLSQGDRSTRMYLRDLLQFYDIQRLRVPRATSFDSNSEHEQPGDEDEVSVADGIIRNQTVCLEELALKLGLDFERIQEEVKEMERFKQQSPLAPERRRHDDSSSGDNRREVKKSRQSSTNSITSPSSNVSVHFLGAQPSSSSPSRISDTTRGSPTQRITSQEYTGRR